MAQQMEAVEGVLAELGLARVPRIEAYNKVDRLPAPPPWAEGEAKVALSAKTGLGLPDLLKAIARALDRAVGVKARGPAREAQWPANR